MQIELNKTFFYKLRTLYNYICENNLRVFFAKENTFTTIKQTTLKQLKCRNVCSHLFLFDAHSPHDIFCHCWMVFHYMCLHLHLFCYSVSSARQLKVSVSKVTEEDYDKLHSDLVEMRKVGEFQVVVKLLISVSHKFAPILTGKINCNHISYV